MQENNIYFFSEHNVGFAVNGELHYGEYKTEMPLTGLDFIGVQAIFCERRPNLPMLYLYSHGGSTATGSRRYNITCHGVKCLLANEE